jgi:uncharacterized membrane protein
MPLSLLYILLLFFVGIFLVALIQVGVITIAFDKLGLSPMTGLMLLFGSLFGSWINIPVQIRKHAVDAGTPPQQTRPAIWGLPKPGLEGKTLIAVNLGGCVIPVGVSLYLLTHHPLGVMTTLLALAGVTAICYWFARPIAGIGIGMPLLLAPLASALIAVMLNPEYSAPLAYVSGTLGVLIGADLLHLRDIDRMGMPIASIGGAGTFDGIFLTGIVAALLA